MWCALQSGTRSVEVTDVWAGLKFVRRLADRSR